MTENIETPAYDGLAYNFGFECSLRFAAQVVNRQEEERTISSLDAKLDEALPDAAFGLWGTKLPVSPMTERLGGGIVPEKMDGDELEQTLDKPSSRSSPADG